RVLLSWYGAHAALLAFPTRRSSDLTAHKGGEFGFGTVFRLTPAGELTVVHAFRGPSFGGATPLSSLTQDAEGNISGTTESGGTLPRGTAWRLDPDGTHSTLHAFKASSHRVLPPGS